MDNIVYIIHALMDWTLLSPKLHTFLGTFSLASRPTSAPTNGHFPMTSRIRGSLIITPRIMPGGAARAVKCIAFYGKTQPAQAFLRVNSA